MIVPLVKGFMIMCYDEAVTYLLEIPKFAGKAGHENLRAYLHRLDDPIASVPAIHIAGTNGKGSVCAFLASILGCAGYRVGMFTSPHLMKINERFRIGEELITDEEFLNVFQRVKQVVDQGITEGQEHPNFFEFLFLMAACWYRDMWQEGQVDYVIYETGLGGRLDATNVLSPCLTVITSIGLDHMQYLGDTIAEIAGEKAGIMKKGVPCVYLTEPIDALAVIEERAREVSAPLLPVEPSQIIIENCDKDWIDFRYHSMYDRTCTYRIRSTALYQTDNAMLAVTAAEYLLSGEAGRNVAEDRIQQWIRQGLATMCWRGRMEELLPDFYVDGAHNEPAIQAFCNTITRIYRDKSVILLFAVSSDKSYNKMIGMLCESLTLKEVIVTAIYGARTTPVSRVADLFRTYIGSGDEIEDGVPVGDVMLTADGQTVGDTVLTADGQTVGDTMLTADGQQKDLPAITIKEDLKDAYEYAKEQLAGTEDCRVFCVGSLYLVGSLMELQNEEAGNSII